MNSLMREDFASFYLALMQLYRRGSRVGVPTVENATIKLEHALVKEICFTVGIARIVYRRATRKRLWSYILMEDAQMMESVTR